MTQINIEDAGWIADHVKNGIYYRRNGMVYMTSSCAGPTITLTEEELQSIERQVK
jgi:hypothetical protein